MRLDGMYVVVRLFRLFAPPSPCLPRHTHTHTHTHTNPIVHDITIASERSPIIHLITRRSARLVWDDVFEIHGIPRTMLRLRVTFVPFGIATVLIADGAWGRIRPAVLPLIPVLITRLKGIIFTESGCDTLALKKRILPMPSRRSTVVNIIVLRVNTREVTVHSREASRGRVIRRRANILHPDHATRHKHHHTSDNSDDVHPFQTVTTGRRGRCSDGCNDEKSSVIIIFVTTRRVLVRHHHFNSRLYHRCCYLLCAFVWLVWMCGCRQFFSGLIARQRAETEKVVDR